MSSGYQLSDMVYSKKIFWKDSYYDWRKTIQNTPMPSQTYATVWSISDESKYMVKMPGGDLLELPLPSGTDLTVGDKVKLDAENLDYKGKVSERSTRRNPLGTVNQDLGEYVAVEIKGTTQKIWNPHQESVEPGDVVEIGDANTIIDSYSDLDISSSPFTPNNKALINSFKDEAVEDKEDILSFDDFGGLTRQQREFRERVELFLRKEDALDAVGTEPRMGALFYGLPGTGKTHFARILSDSLAAQFYRIRGPEIMSKGVGDTERLIRDLFDDAEDESPSIIFFDEIDSIAVERSEEGTRDFSQRIVAQLLAVIDGFDGAQENVFLIAATNQREEIDDALLRPGRFDWEVCFPTPDEDHRKEIFQTLQTDYQVSDDVTEEAIEKIISKTDGWTGADLRALLNEAGILCVSDGRKEIRTRHLLKAYERKDLQHSAGIDRR